jgi:hypothetical protein
VVIVKEQDFFELMTSIEQAGQIRRGKEKPGRIFEYSAPDVKTIRERLRVSQSEFALDGTELGTGPTQTPGASQGIAAYRRKKAECRYRVFALGIG